MKLVLIDQKRIKSLYDFGKKYADDDIALEQMCIDLLETLGNDESEIIEFINKSDKKIREMISSIAQELFEKISRW